MFLKTNKNIIGLLLCFCLFYDKILLFSQSKEQSIANVVSKLSSAVVNISTTQLVENGSQQLPFTDMPEEFFKFFEEFNKKPFLDKPSKIVALGSGFLINDNGHIVTNNHVIDNAQEINITIGNNEKKIYKAKIIGKDKKTDLALLKIDTKDKIPFVKFGDSDKVRIGESVIAIGNAFGFGGTVTSGIISAKGRNLGGYFYEEFLQTDASINKGNSGGPMFNMDGEVIGVNSAIVSPSGGNVGIGFAIPSNTAKLIILKLLKSGKIERPWLGIVFQPVTDDIAKGLNLNYNNGAIVSNVIKNSPAEKAGIIIGDVITKFNGKLLNNINHFPRVVAHAPVNIKISVEIIRKSKSLNLEVVLEVPKSNLFNENNIDNPMETSYCGIGVINLTTETKSKYKIDKDIDGVIVTKVDKNSDASNKGLKPGDIIMSINYEKVRSTRQFRTLLANIKLNSKKKNANAIILISRKNNKLN